MNATLQAILPILRRKALHVGIVVAVLVLTGWLLQPVQQPVWERVHASQPAANLESLGDIAGQGAVAGILGGFRSIAADFLWIRAYLYWEDKELAKTTAMIRLTTAVDSRPLFFWRNGARMITYDMPHWETRALRKEMGDVPRSIEDAIFEDYARRGLAFIDRAREFHPDQPRLLIDQAMIHINKLNDKETGALIFLEVTKMPNAPFFAARIYGELLRQMDRPEEAYAWYRKLYPTLPHDNIYALKGEVLDRIRELEAELQIPREKALP